tara:strand:- start:3283 stop:4191 length:909 start_codon:yes stop_codon:yes gene_type:complete
MVNAKRVGVATLRGDRAGTMSDRLRSFVAGIQVNGKPYFTLVDLDRQTLINEQRLGDSAMFSANTAIELGNLTTADTLLGGSFLPSYNRTGSQKDVQYCALQGEEKCIYYKTKKVNCHEQSASAELNLRATNVERGIVSFTQSYGATTKHSWCDDQVYGAKAKGESDMQNKVIGEVLSQLRRDIAPYSVTFNIKFMKKDASKFGNQEAVKSAFESGLEFVKNQRVPRGCEFFRKAAGMYDQSPAIYHNVGVCSETEGDLDRALAFYQKADRLTLSPNKIIGVSLSRVQNNIASRSAVQSQLR